MKWLIGLVIIIIGGVIAYALPTQNKTTLTWDAPTTNVDGSPITDLGGYKVYWSATSGIYTDLNSKDVGNVLTVQVPTLGIFKGNTCFVLTAYDIAKNESDFSNEVCANFVNKKRPPTNLGIQ